MAARRELAAGAVRTSQEQSVEPQDAVEVGKSDCTGPERPPVVTKNDRGSPRPAAGWKARRLTRPA